MRHNYTVYVFVSRSCFSFSSSLTRFVRSVPFLFLSLNKAHGIVIVGPPLVAKEYRSLTSQINFDPFLNHNCVSVMLVISETRV
mgnify:CR=1 FL=1